MRLSRRLAGEVELVALTRSELDFTNAHSVKVAILDIAPEIVINAAAYTAVDKAESEPDQAWLVNAVTPGVIAETMAWKKGWLIHYSTDYVFDGTGSEPWRETDATGPLSVYGQTKLDGELAIAATGCRHVVLRTSWVYAAEGRNFLHTMLRLGRERDRLQIVDDQIGAPTSAEAITEATLAVLGRLAAGENDSLAGGVYHLACGGATSWYGFARAIFAEFASRRKAPEIVPIPTEAFPTPARRPRNSRLNCDKFVTEFGFRMPEWQDALHQVASAMLA